MIPLSTQLTRPITTAPPSAVRNPSTANPLTSQLVRSSMDALTTISHSPSVTIVIGSVSSLTTGRTRKLTTPSTRPVSSRLVRLL